MVTWVMSDVWEASASHIPIHAVPSTQATARNGSIATQGLTGLVHIGTAASCLFLLPRRWSPVTGLVHTLLHKITLYTIL